MADDKSVTNSGDRKRVAGDQGYEVSYFARKHGLSAEDARTLITRFGTDRTKLNAEAKKMSISGRSSRRRKPPRATNAGNRHARAQSSGTTGRVRSRAITKAAAIGGIFAAGAYLWSRWDELSDQVSDLSDKISGRLRGRDANAGSVGGTNDDTIEIMPGVQSKSGGRSQVEIAQEALTLMETGQATSSG
jgi:hypothetical protein